MKIPHAELAVVPERKLTDYLLNPAHPAGGSKAVFFLLFGFTVADWPRLAHALVLHAQQNEVTETGRSLHGTRFVVEGPLLAPSGAILNVRSAWFIDRESARPRFITAHPLPRK